jgi:hypothetical protein
MLSAFAIAYVLAQLREHVLVRASPVHHPAQQEIDIPPHPRGPVLAPLEAGVRGELAVAEHHAAAHHSSVEALENAAQFLVRSALIR